MPGPKWWRYTMLNYIAAFVVRSEALQMYESTIYRDPSDPDGNWVVHDPFRHAIAQAALGASERDALWHADLAYGYWPPAEQLINRYRGRCRSCGVVGCPDSNTCVPF